MGNVYDSTIDIMQKDNVSDEYVMGWTTGFLHSPKLDTPSITFELSELGLYLVRNNRNL